MAQKKNNERADNIIPNSERTPTERKQIASNGGKASGEARRRRKTFKEAYLSVANEPHKPLGALAEQIAQTYGTVTVDQAIILAQIYRAANGDTAAAVYVRDTIGEKPSDKIDNIISGDLTIKIDLTDD